MIVPSEDFNWFYSRTYSYVEFYSELKISNIEKPHQLLYFHIASTTLNEIKPQSPRGALKIESFIGCCSRKPDKLVGLLYKSKLISPHK